MFATKLNNELMVALIFMSVSFLFPFLSPVAQNHSVSFLPNSGQWDDFVEYRADLTGGVFWMENSGWTAWMAGEGYDELWQHEDFNGDGMPAVLQSHSWKTTFVGANSESIKSGSNPVGHKVNYYRGNDPERWVTGIEPVSTVGYEGVWPGVNLRMDGLSKGTQRLKYDWIVVPGGDPSSIVVRHQGTVPELKPDGTLVHKLGSTGEIIEGAPFAFQLSGSTLLEVDCHYVLTSLEDGSFEVRFEVGDYNPSLNLVIDPDIAFATYIGATQANWGFTAGSDEDGNAIAGAALWDGGMGTYPTTAGAISTDFTFENGVFDIGITVFTPDGTGIIYSTIAGGEGMEFPASVVSDSNGDFYVFGPTGSGDFPITGGTYDNTFNGGPYLDLNMCCSFPGVFNSGSDLYILKFASGTGGLLSGTYVGGSGNEGINSGSNLNYNYGDVFRGEINVDELDRPWVATVTSSTNFPIIGGPYPSYNGGGTDGVLFRMSSDLTTMEWSTYVGGSNDDAAYGVQFTSGFEPVVCGGTRSADFPALGSSHQFALAGSVDAFVTRFPNGGGTPLASTYFGTSDYDQAYFIQLDDDDLVYIYGQTEGDMAIVGDVYNLSVNAGQFVTCFDPQLQNIEWSTRVGAGGGNNGIEISPTAFLVSDCGQIFMSGWGGSTNTVFDSSTNGMPVTSDAFQGFTDGSDFWLGMLNPGGEDLIYGTFFGGGTSAEHVDGGTSRFDKNGTVYQAVCAGCGGNNDFPTTPGAWSSANESINCNLGVFKFELGLIYPDIDLVAPEIICPEDPIQFVNNSQGGGEYFWEFGDGNTSEEFEPTHVYETNGDWLVTMTVSDPMGCLDPQSTDISLTIADPPSPTVDQVEPICNGEEVQLNAWGSEDLFWLPSPTLSATDIPNPIASPSVTTTYIAYDENVCGAAQVEVTVEVSEVTLELSTPGVAICLGDGINITAEGGEDYAWSPPLGISDPTSGNVSASPLVTTQYTITATDQYGCEDSGEVLVTVVPGPPEGIVHDPISICQGYGTSLPASDGDAWLWSPYVNLSSNNSQFPYATPESSITYTCDIQNLCGIGTDEVTVNVIIPEAYASKDGGICRGDEFPISASGNDPESTFNWVPSQLVTQSNAESTEAFPVETTTFTVFVTDSNGCTASDDLTVYVGQPPFVDAGPDREVEWLDEVRLLGSTEGETFWWTPEENLSCSECALPEVLSAEPGWYVFHALDENGCEGTDSTYLDVFFPVYVPTAFTPNNDGENDAFFVHGERLDGYRLVIYNRWGEEVFYSEDQEEVWTGSNQGGSHYCSDGVYLYTLRYEDSRGALLLKGHVTLLR